MSAGEIADSVKLRVTLIPAIMIVFALPPRDSLSNQVSTLSRYGTCACFLGLLELMLSDDITLPNVERLYEMRSSSTNLYTLLIFAPSFSLNPVVPVAATLSLPARSTKLILLTFSKDAGAGDKVLSSLVILTLVNSMVNTA